MDAPSLAPDPWPLAADLARLLGVAVGMRDLLEQLAGDEFAAAIYRRQAAELLQAWQATAPRITAGQERPRPVIVLLEDAGTERRSDREPLGGRRASGQAKQLVIDYLTGRGWATCREIADATGMTPNNVHCILKRGPFTRDKQRGNFALWSLTQPAQRSA
jgi:hypothetical protein